MFRYIDEGGLVQVGSLARRCRRREHGATSLPLMRSRLRPPLFTTTPHRAAMAVRPRSARVAYGAAPPRRQADLLA